MTLSISQIAKILQPITLSAHIANPDDMLSTPLIDSRSLTWPEYSIFFALTTSVNDGHRFLHDLVSRNVRNFVVEDVPQWMLSQNHALNIICVTSSVEALQLIGRYIRSTVCFPVIGITGSRGKTVVKEMLFRDLYTHFNIARSPRSWNSQIGVPMSMWQISPETDLAIFEAGISKPGEMANLEKIIRPTIGIFTPITAEHGENFTDSEQKCLEKAQLFKSANTVFFPAFSNEIRSALTALCPQAQPVPIDCTADNVSRALADAVVAHLCGKIQSQAPAEMALTRIAVHEGVNNCLITYDAFTNDLQSVADALDFISRRRTQDTNITLILSSLENPGNDPQKTYSELAALLKAKDVSRLIAIGLEISRYKNLFSAIPETDFLETSEQFIAAYDISQFSRELILIKGAPEFNFHEIKLLLEQPRHDTTLEVNLDALVHNFNHFRSMLRPETGLIAMVKASAYGIGALETAKTLQSQGAAYLAVAVVDEGVELRLNGITMPILVLNPIGTNYRALFNNHLEPSVFNMRELNLLISQAQRYGVEGYPVHLKLDTGMHRVGFTDDEIPQLCATLASTSTLKVASIFSHLATADCLDLDTYTQSQLDSFERMSSRIISALPYSGVRRHILNTAGIMRYPEYQYDMVRLGIGLYGLSPIELPSEGGLQPVATFQSTIVAIKHWPAGTSIGYGCRGILERDSVIATIPVGYADGIDRHLGRGNTSFLVSGVMCPTVGNICMDQCMIDITDVPNPTIGQTVEIFGNNAPLRRLSDTLGTIPYEILTSVSPRVKRIYFRQ